MAGPPDKHAAAVRTDPNQLSITIDTPAPSVVRRSLHSEAAPKVIDGHRTVNTRMC